MASWHGFRVPGRFGQRIVRLCHLCNTAEWKPQGAWWKRDRNKTYTHMFGKTQRHKNKEHLPSAKTVIHEHQWKIHLNRKTNVATPCFPDETTIVPCSVKSCEVFRTEGPDAPEARARSGLRWQTNNTFTNLNVCWLFQIDSLVKPHVEATNSDDMLGTQTLRTRSGASSIQVDGIRAIVTFK